MQWLNFTNFANFLTEPFLTHMPTINSVWWIELKKYILSNCICVGYPAQPQITIRKECKSYFKNRAKLKHINELTGISLENVLNISM